MGYIYFEIYTNNNGYTNNVFILLIYLPYGVDIIVVPTIVD